MKKYLFILIVGLFNCLYAIAQTPIFTITSGTSHVIKLGTVVSMDGLVLTPSKDFSLSGKSLVHKSTASNTTTNPNINNYYAFNGTTNAYTGAIKFNYSDAELNGLNEANLKLNIFIPSTWYLQQNTSINTADNFTQNTLSAVSMKELTLGYVACIPTSVVATNASQVICTGTSMASITLSDALNTTGTTYSWTRTNTGNVTSIASSGTGSVISGTLVNATTIAQSTVFTITAKRTNGCFSTTTATVTVNPKPSITSQPVNTFKMVGQTASFTVAATGLVTGYQWQQLTTAKGASWTNLSNGGIYSNTTASALTLTGVTLTMNSYQYRCIVKGQCGEVISNSATLSISKNSNTTKLSPGDIDIFEGNKNVMSMEAYPNPTAGEFNLVVNNFNLAQATLRIADLKGVVILVKYINITSTKQIIPLSISHADAGTYLIQVLQSNRAATLMVVKK